ncbi:ATP-binding protein [Aquitalea sp.]|uniref:ATP-binding protein n=1 Tax=Aquitalea sp. TaxID=1872623 RepID=UPI002588031E|nr:ATP-binding protein [Aquitalea sp.]
MTLLRSFNLPRDQNRIVALPPNSKNKNRITVLLGINGTQKSTILRGLLDDALTSSIGSRNSKTISVNAVWSDAPPSRVIAVSSVPNDRFPSKQRFGPVGLRTRYDVPEYEYIGPRTARNIVSRHQSAEVLFASILANPNISNKTLKFLAKLSEKTHIPLRFNAFLRRRAFSSGSSGADISPLEYLQKLLDDPRTSNRISKYGREEIEEALSNSFILRAMEGMNRTIPKMLSKPNRENPHVFVDLVNGLDTSLGIDPKIIRFALNVGYVSLSQLQFDPLHTDYKQATIDSFSAGQWGLFSSLTTLALTASDRTLILVDEPESALHPAWQREYLHELVQALSEHQNCHVVLATHSPLIVSSLMTGEADLVGLRLRNEGLIDCEMIDIPMGWQANDVLEDIFGLESTRSTTVVEDIENALSLIAAGVSGNKSQIITLAKRLTPLLKTFPEEDFARQVINSIIKISGISGVI